MTERNQAAGRASARRIVLFAAVLLAASGFAVGDSFAADPTDEEIFNRRIAEMDAFFEAHPELKTQKGSGWKPFNRMKWWNKFRVGPNGELPEPGARVKAWEVRQEKEARRNPLERASTWFNLGPTNFAGRLLAMAFDPTDPSTMYVGAASGGVWKTTDAGATWSPISDDIPVIAVGGMAVSPLDPNVVVIGTGEGTNNVDRVGGIGILRSTDAGATWETTSLGYNQGSGHGFHFIEAGPNGTMLAGATDGLWRSSDSGATWDTVRVGGDYYDAKWKPGDANRVYTVKGNDGSGNNVKVSTDDGLTWSKAGTGQPLTFQIGKSKLAVSADDPSTVYALFGEFGSATGVTGFYRSQDDGATWTAMSTASGTFGGQIWYNLVCVADPNNVDTVIAGGVGLRRSLNGGSSWSTIGTNVHVDHHAIAYEPGSVNKLWIGGDGGLWNSTNDGSNWVDQNNGIITYQFYDICVNNNTSTPYYIMGGTQDNGTDKWSGTTTWSNGLGADGMVCNINPVNGTTVYAEIQFGSHRKSTSSGSGVWTTINNGITGTGAWVTPVDEDQNVGNHLYTSSSDGIFRTLNGGSNWVNVAPHQANWISISRVDGDVVWTAGSGPAWYTTDDGANWTQASPYPFSFSAATKIMAHPTDVNSALVSFGTYNAANTHVALTTDMGLTWTDVSGDLPVEPVNAIAIDPSKPSDWYVGTDTGVYLSTNGGTSWEVFGLGLPNVVVADLEIQDSLRKLVAGTHGRGAWEADIPLGVGVETTVAPAALNLMLDAPFPNPVSDRTMLRFAAKHAGRVTLDVYDVAGRRVINLVDLPSGDGVIRTTPWLPDRVPGGVYFAVLKAGDESVTRKLVVLE